MASADIALGSARICNVAFLVFSDKAMHIAPMRLQMRGFLGLPVLRTLQQDGISRDGTLRIRPRESSAADAKGEPNLFFDRLNPAAASHGERRLQERRVELAGR